MFDWFWKFFTIPKPCDRPDFEYIRTIHDDERVEHSVLINGKPVEGEEAERISAMVHDVFEHADRVFEHADRVFDAVNKMFDDLGNERNKEES